MDLETENRIAAILLKEAAELRRQAQSEGALAYLRQPSVRCKPNSRFLTATVLGVQQANRAVEVNEMWRIREKQIELDHKKLRSRNESRNTRGCADDLESHKRRRCNNEVESSSSASLLSKKRYIQDLDEDEGLRDDEVDEFLQSRTKRGRGAIGSRMDETGPYPQPDSDMNLEEGSEKARVFLGPEKPYSLKHSESSDNESCEKKRKKKKEGKRGSSKRHSEKHKSKDKKRMKSREKRSKHHK